MGHAAPTPPPAVLLALLAGPGVVAVAPTAVADGPAQSWRHLR